MNPYPDYHPPSPLSFDPLGILMVQGLISLGDCFEPPITSPTF